MSRNMQCTNMNSVCEEKTWIVLRHGYPVIKKTGMHLVTTQTDQRIIIFVCFFSVVITLLAIYNMIFSFIF